MKTREHEKETRLLRRPFDWAELFDPALDSRLNRENPYVVEKLHNKAIAQQIRNLFFKTMDQSKFEVTGIELLKNIYTWRPFKLQSEMVLSQLGQKTFDDVVRLLFYASYKCDFRELAESKHGITMGLKVNGPIGRGVYYTEDASFAHENTSNCVDEDKEERQVLLSVVLVGDSKQYEGKARDLIKAPVRPGSNERFDSVNGMFRDSRVFVLFEERTALPGFIVTYKKRKLQEIEFYN